MSLYTARTALTTRFALALLLISLLAIVGFEEHIAGATLGSLPDIPETEQEKAVGSASVPYQSPPAHRTYLPLAAGGRQRALSAWHGVQASVAGNASTNAEHIKTLGFGWVKVHMPWKQVEPNAGDYRWGIWDQLINTYHGEGIKILVTIVSAPNWARPSGTNFNVEGPPADPSTYASFVAQFAGRYCGRAHAIEVWNEQNVFYQWGGEPIDAGRYMTLLRSAYLATKRACPNMAVVSGGLLPTGAPPPWALDDVIYLQQMYQAGLRNYCDAIGAHAPGYNNPPEAGVDYTDPSEPNFKGHRVFFFRATLEEYRRVMVSFGDANKRIWPTEFGWASEPNPAEGYTYARDNTLTEQAEYSVRAYQMAQNWGWIGPMFIWNLDFGVVYPNTELAYWSLLRPEPVPAYTALAAMPK